jgi:Pectate lyase superfamily protein
MLRNKGTFLLLVVLLCSPPLHGQIIGAQRAVVPSSQSGDIIHVKDFGATGDDDTDDTSAIQAAIDFAQNSGGNRSVMLGAGIFRVSKTLRISGANKGISILGSPWASLQQGNALPASTIWWTGGASPVFDVTTTFTHFISFSILNQGAATSALKFTDGSRVLLFGMSFALSSGSSVFRDAAVWFDQTFAYMFIDRCEFEVSPAIKITGSGTTIEIIRSVFDGVAGANPFLKVDANIDLLKVERNTFIHRAEVNVAFDNATGNSGTNIGIMRVVANEFDADASPSSRIILGENILNLTFEDNQVDNFGSITDSLIQLTNSRARVSGNWGESIKAPLVRTLDTASRVFVGPNNFTLGNTQGILEDGSESGGIVDITYDELFGPLGNQVRLQGNLGSPGSETIYRIIATDDRDIEVTFSKPSDSLQFGPPGYMTKGQRFAVMVINRSGRQMGTVTFLPSHFRTSDPLNQFPAPMEGKNRSIAFVHDGFYAVELWRGAEDVDNPPPQ